MHQHETNQPDYGTGQKKLGMYVMGIIGCAILTLIAFWAVMYSQYSTHTIFAIIYTAAVVQFLVQVICFLRLNTETQQGVTNVMSLVFTGVILVSIISGSLWIMWNLNYYMMN